MNGSKPYVGAGVNYTRFSSVDLWTCGPVARRHHGQGQLGAGRAGGRGHSTDQGRVPHLDLKKVMIRTDVKLAGAKVGEFKADPLLFGVGLGWRF